MQRGSLKLTLRLYADECVDARIVASLRARDVDIITANDLELLGATDLVHLEGALRLGRVVLSADQDFLRLADARIRAGESFPGLIFLLPGIALGRAVRQVEAFTVTLEHLNSVKFVR